MLTDREKFILHVMQTMTSINKFVREDEEPSLSSTNKMQNFIELLLKNRCRKLDKSKVNELFEDISEELLLSDSFYQENNI